MGKGKFNLTSLLNERSTMLKEETQEDNTQDFEIKSIDVFDLEPSKENFYDTSEIEKMKQSIELLGIEQNLIVKKTDGNKYKVLAGHRRRLAAIELTKEGKGQYRYVPCRVKSTSEILDKLTIIMTNSTQRELKDWEKMKQALEIEELVMELKQEAKIPGRTRDLIAEILNTSPAQLGRYKAIENHLSKELMEEFKNDNISFTVANESSGLSTQGQQKALKKLIEEGSLLLSDVKQIKRAEEEAKPIEGQINTFNPTKESVGENKPGEETRELDKPAEVQEVVEVENENAENLENKKIEEQKSFSQEQQEEQQSNVIIVEQQREESCNHCTEEEKPSITTQNGTFLIKIDLVTHQAIVIHKDTGEADMVEFTDCPICGSAL